LAIEQIRQLLLIALVGVLFLMWQAWLEDYGRQAPEGEAQQGTERTAPPDSPGPPERADAPDAPAPGAAPQSAPEGQAARQADVPEAPSAAGTAAPEPEQAATPERTWVHVRTGVLEAWIDPRGGDLRRVDLLNYPVSPEQPDTPVSLLHDTGAELFVAQSGLIGARDAPNHYTEYRVERSDYRLAAGQDAVQVRLNWRGDGGVTVTKVYTFRRDSYVVGVAHEVENAGAEAWSARMYGQLQRTAPEGARGLFRIPTYTGGVISTAEKPYEKVGFDDMAERPLDLTTRGGWAAMIQHYFAAAWVPAQENPYHYYTKALDGERYVIGLISPERALAPGSSGRFDMRMYVGPKIADRLAELAPHLERAVDYGWLWFLSEPLFWLLDKIHGYIGNWGWSIVVLTLLIKLAFFHLSATSYKSMARMRKLQPRLLALRERYGSDKQRMNQAMMQLYKEEKINPLGGCLPILVQIPVFIALYWVLIESVELRHADFMFWIDDLSSYDPYFVLPILMGITMFLQQRLNPTPPDPMQARIMQVLPVVFTFFFLFFPAGLVLYWLVNNVLSILQQWVITRRIAPDVK